jgi:SAM-dependent methyltransferase
MDLPATKRFAFGRNWQRYIKDLSEDALSSARTSVANASTGLEIENCSFLDIGSGSGLFSRAAYDLSFSRVVSFDYDLDSVDATRTMHANAGADREVWTVEQGSVLDEAYMAKLGQFDFVYSWGVLHHTGNMHRAIELAAAAVKPNGRFCIAIYNDQGWISSYWLAVKKTYVMSPRFFKAVILALFFFYFGAGLFVADLLRFRNPLARHMGDRRGMKFWTDVIDWVGGYPFEVATPKEIAEAMSKRGFKLLNERRAGRRHGCNEFLFEHTN